jgi:regulatory protein
MPADIITRLERQKHARHRVSVYLDGVFAFGISEETAIRFGLAKGMYLSAEIRLRMEATESLHQAKLVAQRFIVSRRRSENEIRQKLALKGFSPAVIDETVDALTRVQLIDDQAFAEAFVHDRMRFKPKSQSVLRRELRAKGISGNTADSVLEKHFSHENEEHAARQAADQFLNRNKHLDTEKRNRRLAGFLQRRGFSFSVIRQLCGGVENEE